MTEKTSHSVPDRQIISLWAPGTPGITSDPEHEVEPHKFNIIRNPSIIHYPAPRTAQSAEAIVICPGGGYEIVSCSNEGYPIAEWLNKLGISAFVLKYRLPGDTAMNYRHPVPLADVQQALRIVRRRAGEFNVNPGRIGVIGFSAGGHLAAMAATAFDTPVVKDPVSCRPDFAMLIYPVIATTESFAHHGSFLNLAGSRAEDTTLQRKLSPHLNVTGATPPTFLAHAKDDGCVPFHNSVVMDEALRAVGIPSELHLYETGGHGFGLGSPEHDSSKWPEDAARWFKTAFPRTPSPANQKPQIGIPEMDTQHAYLYDLFDRLGHSQSRERLGELLEEIEGMLDFHFSSEEHFIRHYKVPGFAEHKKDHELAANAFLQGLDAFEREQLNPVRLQKSLAGWLFEHSRSADMQYARIVRNRRKALL